MKLEGRKLVLGTRPCWRCNGTRKANKWVACQKCGGSGYTPDNRTRNKRLKECGGCKKYRHLNMGSVLLYGQPCDCCTDGTQPENFCDFVLEEIYLAMPFKVYRNNEGPGLTHSINPVFSCTDYGDWRKKTDAELIAGCQTNYWRSAVPACKIADKEGNLLDHIGIFCYGGGYKVVAVRGDEKACVSLPAFGDVLTEYLRNKELHGPECGPDCPENCEFKGEA